MNSIKPASTTPTKEIKSIFIDLSIWREEHETRGKKCANQPRSPLRRSLSMGGPVGQLTTEILHTVSVLDTRVSSRECSCSRWRTMWETRNSSLDFTQGCVLRAHLEPPQTRRGERTPSHETEPLCACDSLLWWGESHGAAVPWSCWPPSARVAPSPWSPSTGAAPTLSKWTAPFGGDGFNFPAAAAAALSLWCDLISEVNQRRFSCKSWHYGVWCFRWVAVM